MNRYVGFTLAGNLSWMTFISYFDKILIGVKEKPLGIYYSWRRVINFFQVPIFLFHSPLYLIKWHGLSSIFGWHLLVELTGVLSLADLNDPEGLSEGGWMHKTSLLSLYDVTDGASRVLSS